MGLLSSGDSFNRKRWQKPERIENSLALNSSSGKENLQRLRDNFYRVHGLNDSKISKTQSQSQNRENNEGGSWGNETENKYIFPDYQPPPASDWEDPLVVNDATSSNKDLPDGDQLLA